jgi:hypothetical protein
MMEEEEEDEIDADAARLEPPFGRAGICRPEFHTCEPSTPPARPVHRGIYDRWYRVQDPLLGNHQFGVLPGRPLEDLGAMPI